MVYRLVLDTVPVPKGRPRFARRGNFIQTYTPTKTIEYEKLIAEGWTNRVGYKFPPERPIIAMIRFYMPIPESYSKKKKQELKYAPHTKKSDIDNLLKSVFDGLNGVAFEDDSQVFRIIAEKRYAEEPSICIELYDYEEEVIL